MLKKGDVVSVSYRRGYDIKGNPIMETFDRCVVEEINGSQIQVSYRVIEKTSDGKDSLELHTMNFNVNSPEFISVEPAK